MENHISYSVQRDCQNPYDSYGEICVHCNCCGRYDKASMYQCQIDVLKRRLQETKDFDNWFPEFEAMQRENKQENIEYLMQKIKEAEEKQKYNDNFKYLEPKE